MTARLLGGRYLLESEVARGGMAAVWRAVDNVLGRTVAAKVLHSHLTEDPTFRERFRIEALAAARLTHPNIVSIFDTGSDEGTPFIVMEYLAGGTLKDMITLRGRLDPATIARVGAEACSALSYAHRLGVVHRDIKPANILFSEHGHVKVSDFGIAKAAFAKADLTDSGAVLGTVRYLAPEQVEGIEPDGRADIYSLAVVMYEALTGRPAFSGENQMATAAARLENVPPPLRRSRPDVPVEMEAAIMKCLMPGREDRFADAAAFGSALALSVNGRSAASGGKLLRKSRASPPARTAAGATGSGFLKAEAAWLVPVILVIILAAGLTIAVPSVRNRVGEVIRQVPLPGQQQTVKVSAWGTYDPPPGDGSENDEQTSLAFDSDKSTAWRTSNYRTAKLGGLKPGVGIFFDLGKPVDLKKISVTSFSGGWQATIRSSADGRNWSTSGRSETAGQQHVFSTRGSDRYWMIWITELTRTTGGRSENPYSVAISEIVPSAR